jgi:hypothetical protein
VVEECVGATLLSVVDIDVIGGAGGLGDGDAEAASDVDGVVLAGVAGVVEEVVWAVTTGAADEELVELALEVKTRGQDMKNEFHASTV